MPERSATALGQRKPTAKVCFSSASDSGEYSVPKAVGRKLASREYAGKVFGSRAELVHELLDLQYRIAWARLCDLVNRRDYSQAEMRKKLELDGYWDKPIDSVLSRAVEQRYINDLRYADVFVRSKLAAGWGKAKVERELKQRGIEPSGLPGWPEVYCGDDEFERAFEAARRKTFRAKDPYAQCVRFLAGRGYGMTVAHRVARRLISSDEEYE